MGNLSVDGESWKANRGLCLEEPPFLSSCPPPLLISQNTTEELHQAEDLMKLFSSFILFPQLILFWCLPSFIQLTVYWSSVDSQTSSHIVKMPSSSLALLHRFGSQLWLYTLFCKITMSRADFHADEAKAGNGGAIAARIGPEIVWMQL